MGLKPWLESQLSLSFGKTHHASGTALRFDLKTESRRIAICGPSGVGKSSFLKILAGVERRSRGFLRVDGEVWQDSKDKTNVSSSLRRVGWVPQNALLFPHLDVKENLLFSKGSNLDDMSQIASELKIGHLLDRKPRNLSGGERSRVALGRALLSRPKILLLDEPLAALNDSLRSDVALFLARFCITHDVALVLATHRRSEATALCDEVLEWGEKESDQWCEKSSLSFHNEREIYVE